MLTYCVHIMLILLNIHVKYQHLGFVEFKKLRSDAKSFLILGKVSEFQSLKEIKLSVFIMF